MLHHTLDRGRVMLIHAHAEVIEIILPLTERSFGKEGSSGHDEP